MTSGNLNTLAGSSQLFALDAVGNQTSTTTDGTTTTKSQNSKNELTGVGSSTLAYDNDGNTTTDASGHTLAYDAWNRMVTDSAGTTGYTFDANGRRITETHGSTTTDLYFTTPGQVIEERQGSTVIAQNVWSIDYVNSLLLRDDNSTSGNLGISGSGLGNRVYYQHDSNYNVTSTLDNSGNVIQRYVYTPYGAQIVLTAAWATSAAAHSIYGFQGGRLDLSTGLLRFGVRDYNPITGTWNEQDSAYFNGSNLYQFETGNPVGGLDPSGHVKCAAQINNGILDWVEDHEAVIAGIGVGLAVGIATGGSGFVVEGMLALAAGGFTYGVITGYAQTGTVWGALQEGVLDGSIGALGGIAGGLAAMGAGVFAAVLEHFQFNRSVPFGAC